MRIFTWPSLILPNTLFRSDNTRIQLPDANDDRTRDLGFIGVVVHYGRYSLCILPTLEPRTGAIPRAVVIDFVGYTTRTTNDIKAKHARHICEALWQLPASA